MNRRGFLQLLGLAAAGAVLPDVELDPDRALWVPGAKSIFDLGAGVREVSGDLYSRSGDASDWPMFDVHVFTREALKVLENNLNFARSSNRQYDERFRPDVGFTVSVKLPARYDAQFQPGDRVHVIQPQLAGRLTERGFTPEPNPKPAAPPVMMRVEMAMPNHIGPDGRPVLVLRPDQDFIRITP